MAGRRIRSPSARLGAAPAAIRRSTAALLAVASLALPAGAGRAAQDSCGAEPAAPLSGAVARDARTLDVGSGPLVRLAGIESFAALLDDAEAADASLIRTAAAHLAHGPARLHLLPGDADRRGRRPGIVLVGDRSLQERLVAEGLALVVPDGRTPPACLARWLAAEAEAQEARRGLWADRQARILPAVPQALSDRTGRFAIVNGLVLSVGLRRSRAYLNFGTKWSEDVTVEIESRDWDAFGGPGALEALPGRRVRVRGYVEERAGPLIRLRWPAQIEVLPAAVGR